MASLDIVYFIFHWITVKPSRMIYMSALNPGQLSTCLPLIYTQILATSVCIEKRKVIENFVEIWIIWKTWWPNSMLMASPSKTHCHSWFRLESSDLAKRPLSWWRSCLSSLKAVASFHGIRWSFATTKLSSMHQSGDGKHEFIFFPN